MYHGCDITITPTCFLVGPAGKLTDLIPWLDAVGLMMETFPGLEEPSEDGEEETATPEQPDEANPDAEKAEQQPDAKAEPEAKTETKTEAKAKAKTKAKPKADVVNWEDEEDEEELAELNMHNAYRHYDEKRRLYMRQALAWGFKYEAETLASLRLQRIWRGAADRFSPIFPLRIQRIHLARRYIDRLAIHHARVIAAAAIIVRYPRSFLARRQRRALLGRKALLALNHERYPQIRQDIRGAQPADWDSAPDVEYVLTKPKHLVTYREIDFMYMVSEFWAEHEVADDASAEIQRIWHGFKGRRRFKKLLAIKLEEERRKRDKAVRLIQRVFRGYMGNKRFREKRFQVRTQQALVQYKMQKRTERERKDWQRKLTQDALRQRILREHREQMAEEKLRAELQFKQKKAFYAAQMKVAVVAEKQAYASVQVLNAWRQRAEADGRVYYFNDITLEATYDPPPHWRLPTNEPLKVLYWKNLEDVKHNFCQTITEAENALCRHCHERNARRECHECLSRYCVECYIKYHSKEETRHHTYDIIEVDEPRVLLCTKCNERDAQVKCCDEEKVFCQPCFEETHTSGLPAKHKYLNFKVGTPICIECDDDFAVWNCRECGDVFCDKCCKEVHAKGKLRTHQLKKMDVFEKDVLQGDEQYCNDCELRKADRICDQCGDWFCKNCYDSTHKKGRRSKHTWTPWGRAGVSSGWEEFFDEEKGVSNIVLVDMGISGRVES